MSNMPPQDSSRLDRIEFKIDKLAEAVIAIARAEEKIIALDRSNSSLVSSYIKLEERLSDVENNTASVIKSHASIVKMVWGAITGAVTAGVLWFFQR